jgi:hypothetical protein
MSRFQDVKKAFASARKKYDGYYSQCAHFASAFSRALIDDFEWPRELVVWERPGAGPVAHVEDALVLEEDTFWHLGLRLRLQGQAPGNEDIRIAFRFKRSGDQHPYLLELFPGVEFEVREPVIEEFQPILDALFEEIATHYERGLDLFLENRSGRLRVPFAVPAPKPLPEERAGEG